MDKASKHPPGLQSPHVTKKIRLPSGNSCRLPFKEQYGRQFRTIDGLDEIQTVRRRDNDVISHLVCPEDRVDLDIPDTTKPVPTVAESSSSEITPPQAGVFKITDVHLGVGFEFDRDGHSCRRDVINRFYRVDEYGMRIINRTTTCPLHLDSEALRKTFAPKDRVQWYVDMKAREVAEAKAKEESASSSTNVINPVALHAAPALFAAPKKRRDNPVHKTKQLGIAGLFSEESAAYVYGGSDSEACTSGAAPAASVIESEGEEVRLGSFLRMDLKLKA